MQLQRRKWLETIIIIKNGKLFSGEWMWKAPLACTWESGVVRIWIRVSWKSTERLDYPTTDAWLLMNFDQNSLDFQPWEDHVWTSRNYCSNYNKLTKLSFAWRNTVRLYRLQMMIIYLNWKNCRTKHLLVFNLWVTLKNWKQNRWPILRDAICWFIIYEVI